MNQNIIDQIIKLENELKTLKEMIAPVKPAVKNRRINTFRSARMELL